MKETFYNGSLLENHFNVEYPSIIVKSEIENVEVSLFYSPPHLHTGILGPGNNAIKHIDKYVDL